ncbi:MAG: hypothetical protein JWN02_2067, partial [Acidobacteria bacterium]|nr:hypothetical protein [Acidobacteriota bacterium]
MIAVPLMSTPDQATTKGAILRSLLKF